MKHKNTTYDETDDLLVEFSKRYSNASLMFSSAVAPPCWWKTTIASRPRANVTELFQIVMSRREDQHPNSI